MSDNFHFDLTGVALDKCLEIAFSSSSRQAVGWNVDEPTGHPKRMVLYWSPHESMTAFPAKMGAADVESFVRAWLNEVNYGGQPDHDGDNEKGWRVYNEAWGHIGSLWQAFVAIEPCWLMYGK